MPYCTNCGASYPEGASQCPNCHKPTGTQTVNNYYAIPQGKPVNKWVAFLLCIFLGPLGIHKFYEGKVGMGLLYIFTGGLFGFGWIIDCILILFKSNPYYVK